MWIHFCTGTTTTFDKLVVQRLVQKYAEEAAKEKVTEDETRQYYQAHLSEYVRPDRIRVAQILTASPQGDAGRPKAKAEADKLLADVKAKEASGHPAAFTDLAMARSDDGATKASGGDLGFKTAEELTAQYGKELADAALSLKNLGELGVAAGPRGLHLLKLLGRQPGLNRTFDDAIAKVEVSPEGVVSIKE